MIAIIAINKKSKLIALKIKKYFSGAKVYSPGKGKLADLTGKLFCEADGIVFCMAMGIAARMIAPYIKDKYSDPAVVVVDNEARFAISALSGHEGGANILAVKVANILGAEPVITTASESAKNIVIGIGCRRGIKKAEVIRAFRYVLGKIRVSPDKVRHISTIDLKKNEPGLKGAVLSLGIPLRIVSTDTIKNFNGKYQRSAFVKGKIGVEGVSEPCALLTARKPKLILAKQKIGGVTVAAARES